MDQELREKMIQTYQSFFKILNSASQEFKSPSERSVRELEAVRDRLQRDSSELTQLLVQKAASTGQKEWVKPYLSIVSSFDRMEYNIDGILDRLKKMVHEEILFTDRGINEVNHVFQETLQLLENLPDTILTQNRLLAEQLREKGKMIFRLVDGYAEEHEKRLIEGVCVPKASPIYLGFLESLKGIVAHTLEIIERLFSLSARV